MITNPRIISTEYFVLIKRGLPSLFRGLKEFSLDITLIISRETFLKLIHYTANRVLWNRNTRLRFVFKLDETLLVVY